MLSKVFKGNFSISTIIAAFAIATAVDLVFTHTIKRTPAAAEEPIELHIQTLALDSVTRLKDTQNIFVRATFNQTQKYEWGKNEGWSLQPGEKRPLDIVLKVQNSWIKNDELEFKLELVKSGSMEPVLVRCAMISKQLSGYNRNYTCNIPGEKRPLFTYRLGRKVPEDMKIAQTAPVKSAAVSK